MTAGIIAKFPSDCPLCGNRINKGDAIERIPGEDKVRGHVACVEQAERNGGRSTGADRTTPSSARGVTPSSNGHAIPNTAALETMRAGLAKAIEANKEAADSLDLMREGMVEALSALDAILSPRQAVGSRR